MSNATKWSGRAIRLAREIRGIEFEQFAHELDCTQMRLLAIERGVVQPDVSMVGTVAMRTSFPLAFFKNDHETDMHGRSATLFFCHPLPEDERCKEAGCHFPAEAVCDIPVGDGKTCDRGMCHDHRNMVKENIDVCAFHRDYEIRKRRPAHE